MGVDFYFTRVKIEVEIIGYQKKLTVFYFQPSVLVLHQQLITAKQFKKNLMQVASSVSNRLSACMYGSLTFMFITAFIK